MDLKRPGILALAAILMLTTGLVATQAGDPVPPDKALLVIRLPAEAKLIIGSSETMQLGPERQFLSPPLDPAKKYTYELTATWTENGKPQKQRRLATVRAGQRTMVNFLEPEALPEPKPEKPEKPDPNKKVPPENKKPEKKTEPTLRSFFFTYAGAVKDLKPGTPARVWLPRPHTTPQQSVQIGNQNLPEINVYTEKQYGNKMYYFEAKADKAGRIPFSVTYRVTRKEVRAADGGTPGLEDKLPRFLQADAKVPVNGKPMVLIRDKKLPADTERLAKALYDVVNEHMEYRKDKDKPGWGEGDAVWACDSKFGNCSDFHSLFISLARSMKLPAKFEMGFSVPDKSGKGSIGGYHCWAWYYVEGKGWLPVDISEANRHPKKADYYFGNLSDNRVQFTVGRDVTLNPPQAGKALNFFIYPYVEVNGKPYTAVEQQFSYESVP